MKILLIANCHVEPIGWFLSSHHEVEKILTIPIHLAGTKRFEQYQNEFTNFYDPNEYVVLTFHNNDSYGKFSFKELSLLNSRVYTITNLFFSGLHPDITYCGGSGRRIQSPLGDYHSKIILYSYLTNKSTDNCIKSFNQKFYEEFKYFDEYDNSSNELIRRDAINSIKFAEEFLETVKISPSLFTVNHPVGNIFQEFSISIASKLGLNLKRWPTSMIPNHLSNSTWWPIYPEFSDHFHLKYKTPFIFKQPFNRGRRLLSLEDFVLSSYKIYSEKDSIIRGSKLPDSLLNILDRKS
jgi:hypothetical protein